MSVNPLLVTLNEFAAMKATPQEALLKTLMVMCGTKDELVVTCAVVWEVAYGVPTYEGIRVWIKRWIEAEQNRERFQDIQRQHDEAWESLTDQERAELAPFLE